MATTITRYVNRASNGGNGTTNDTSGANAAYADLAACIAAEITARRELATRDEILRILCCGSTADTSTTGGADGYIAFDHYSDGGFNTDATRYVILEGNPDHPNGRNFTPAWSTSHYRISNAPSGTGYSLLSRIKYFRMIGIQVENTAATGYSSFRYEPRVSGANDGAILESCICRGAAWTTFGDAYNHRDGKITYRNCIAIGSPTINAQTGFAVTYGPDGPPIAIVENCVALNMAQYGFFSDSSAFTFQLKNCYAGLSGTADYSLGYDAAPTTCHSEDGSSGDWGSTTTTSIANAAFTSTTEGSEDVRIASNSALKDVGTDLSSDFTTDFAGSTRPTGANTWDVGAYEYGAAAPAGADPSFWFRNPTSRPRPFAPGLAR